MIAIEMGGDIPPQILSYLGGIIAKALSKYDPVAAQSVMGGVLANIVGNIPDEHWEKMKTEAALPCDRPGCTCHLLHKSTFDQLELLRQFFNKVTTEENPDEKGFAE